MTIDELDKIYNNMSVYGDTYNTAPSFDGEFKEKILPVDTSIPIVKQLGTPYNNNDNKIAANNNIDYNNLIIPSLKSEPQSNMFTDAMGNIKSFAEKNKLLSGIMKAGSFIKDPITGAITSLLGMLPEQDPRATATKNFYDDNFGLTSSGSVASGIMANYNPVSGGLFGGETQYGLTPAIDRRIAKINQTLNKYDKYKYGNDKFDPYKYNQQIKKLEQLEKIKEAELAAQEKVKEKEYQERITKEADTAARARAANAAVYASADRQGFTNSGGGFSTSAADKAGTSEGSGQFSSSSGRGRTGYGTGGIVSL